MRRITALVFALCMVIAPLNSFGAETTSATGKDYCLLYSQNCPNQSLSYQEKIARFKDEINKGAQVYSTAELQRLNAKLKDTEELYYNLVDSPSSHGYSSRGGFGRGHR